MADAKGTIRLVKVESTLGKDAFRFRRMSGSEELGRLYSYTIELESKDHALKLDKVLGEHMTVTIEMAEAGAAPRYFHGFVSEFAHVGGTAEYSSYQATLRPWLWFLTRTSDCRIFQNMTVPQIIEQVFKDQGFSDYESKLNTSGYATWEYCVQYRETDFNFVSRLMEQEGIYYFFRHEKGKHWLVLVDGASDHAVYPGYGKIAYKLDTPGVTRHEDCISGWAVSQAIQPGRYAHTDFNFKKPKASLLANSKATRTHGRGDMEIFDSPGEYEEIAEGETYARIRLQEIQAQFETVRGEGNARGVAVGYTFSLTGCPRSDQNREYLVTSASYQLRDTAYESGSDSGEMGFSVEFAAIEAKCPYRSPRITPKPVVQGPQTAMVVGPASNDSKEQEIYTDKFGRVKVQFHWDRDRDDYAKKDRSCWIRVAQVWGGKQWGGQFIPRVGQEVIVEFLEGDPDWPIITGAVYNDANQPPFKLPDNKTVSTLKTNTSQGGGGFNELRFQDEKGKEQLFMHAQRDMDIRAKNDRYETIEHDRHLVVGHDKLEHVKNSRHEVVDKDHKEVVSGNVSVKIAGHEMVEIGNKLSVKVAGDVAEKFAKNNSRVVDGDVFIKAKNIVLEADLNVTIKIGGTSIAADASGVKIATSGQIELDAAAVLTAKGSLVKIN